MTAWFNADLNYLFVEICPEEALRIGLTLKIPILSEAAFRILANERALEVAGGQPRFQPARTIFGRRCSHFTDDTESISRIIDHAGTAMADRYKSALDTVFSDDLLDRLYIDEWKELCALDEIIPKPCPTDLPLPVRTQYEKMMANARAAVRQAIDDIFQGGGAHLLEKNNHERLLGGSWQAKFSTCLDADVVDAKRSYTVPKRELSGSQSFEMMWKHWLNQHQRALCPLFWQGFRYVSWVHMYDKFFSTTTDITADFIDLFAKAQGQREQTLPASPLSIHALADDPSGYFCGLFQHVVDALHAFATRLVDRDGEAFAYTVTPHLLLTLDDDEMNFLRLADDETRFQADVPEADMGPSGPGPAFHTGHSVVGASDLDADFENLALVGDDDGASTVVGSLVAQDGVSTVYDRRRVLAATSSASERFTDDEEDSMSAEYVDSVRASLAARQSRGQVLEAVVEGEERQRSDEGHGAFGLSDDDEELEGDDEDEESDGSISEEKESDFEEGDDDFEIVSMSDCR